MGNRVSCLDAGSQCNRPSVVTVTVTVCWRKPQVYCVDSSLRWCSGRDVVCSVDSVLSMPRLRISDDENKGSSLGG